MMLKNLSKPFVFSLVIVSTIFLSQQAMALIWTETPDAGDLPGTAQVIVGPGSLDSIHGVISADVDMYEMYITDPAAFSATTVGTTSWDTQLFLFDSGGLGVIANDDTNIASQQSTLPAGDTYSPTAAGTYYLAISAFNSDPTNSLGSIFSDVCCSPVGPTGPGGSQAISGWTSAGLEGGYIINLTGAAASDGAPVPEPATMLLLGTGLVGLVGFRKKFK